MRILKEFIWYKDHFVYHITSKDNIKSIKEKGLVPNLGERSKLLGDNEKAIYFFDSFTNMLDWMNVLYKDENKDNLEVLKFNIKRRKWYLHNGGEDFYVKRKVEIEKLEILRVYDTNNNIIPYSKFNYDDNNNYKWIKLKER